MVTRDEIIQFTTAIEDLVWDKDISYMEAILLYCEEKGVEIEVAAKMVPDTIWLELKKEAEALHFLPKSNVSILPI